MTLHPQFVVDERGMRRKVLLPIEEYEELLETLQDVIDAGFIVEVRNQPRVAWNDVKAKRQRE